MTDCGCDEGAAVDGGAGAGAAVIGEAIGEAARTEVPEVTSVGGRDSIQTGSGREVVDDPVDVREEMTE
jgi:hypothetical protein